MMAGKVLVVSEVTMILTGRLYAEVQLELEVAAPPSRCVLRLLCLLDHLFVVVLQVRL